MQSLDIKVHVANFFTAALNGDRRRIKKILDKGISVQSKDENSKTPLYLACQGGHGATVSLLIERMADPNSRCCDGSTPMHVTGLSGNIKIMMKLINAGGDLRYHDYKNRSVYEWASNNPDEKKKKRMQEFLLKQRLFAMGYSPNCKEGKSVADPSISRNEDLAIGWLKTNCRPFIPPLFCLGFGTMYLNAKKEISMATSVRLVAESSLKHDEYGCTYNNGPFAVMESMNWGDTKVTVKRLHTFPPSGGCVDLLIRECSYIAKLRHTSIVLLMGICQTIQMDGLILLFERIHHGSLFSLIYIKADTLSAHEMCVILSQVSDAVAFLHQRNLLHCCITSHAIHMYSRNCAKLGNFEYMIETDVEDTPRALPSLLDNRYMNSCYNWMAPEVMAGNAITDRSDMYSLASVLWELIHGLPPWSGMDAADIEVEILRNHNSLHIKESIQDPFHCLLQYGLARDVSERQLSVVQLRDVLNGFMMDEDYQGIHHLASTSLSVDPGDPTSVSRIEEQDHTEPSVEYTEVSEVCCSQVSRPWSIEESHKDIAPTCDSSHTKAAEENAEPAAIEKVPCERSEQNSVSGNDATLNGQDSHNSRNISTQTVVNFEMSKQMNDLSNDDDEPKPEILTPEHLRTTNYPKASTPNKVPMKGLNENSHDQSLKITDDDIAGVLFEAESTPIHQENVISKPLEQSKNEGDQLHESIEKITVQKSSVDIPKILADLENSVEDSMKYQTSSTDVVEEEITVTESDSQSQVDNQHRSKSKFSILSFLSSKSSKKSTDQDSASEKAEKGVRNSKKTRKKSSERAVKYKKTATESSDDQADSQFVRDAAKRTFLAGKKIRMSRSNNEKMYVIDKNSDPDMKTKERKAEEAKEVLPNDALHTRLSCYKIDISGIDKLDTEASSKTQSEAEEVLQKRHNIPPLALKPSSCDEEANTDDTERSGNPFKKFVTADYDDIFTDEIKAILAKPMKMPKLPSQYSRTSVYSRPSVEKKPPSMADTLMRLYSPTNSHSNIRASSFHASATEKANSLPIFSGNSRTGMSLHDVDRSLSSAHSSRYDTSHLDASESNASSVTVKPASHHEPKNSPFNSNTEHFAFPRSPRENTYPGSVSAHTVLLKELQSYHKSHPSSAPKLHLNNITKKGERSEVDANVEQIQLKVASELQSGVARQVSTVVSPRHRYLTKPEVSPRNEENPEKFKGHSEKKDKGWTGPVIARAKFFGLGKLDEKLRSDTAIHLQQRNTGRNMSATIARSHDRTTTQVTPGSHYTKNFTLPGQVSSPGFNRTGIHSVKDMTASFQKKLEQHVQKQAILVKKRIEGIPYTGGGGMATDTFITPQQLKCQTLPARLNQVQAFTATGDQIQHQSFGKKISSLNIELQKIVGFPPSVTTKNHQKDPNGSFLNASPMCEKALQREINVASPARCNRSSDENDEELCSFVEDLINVTHEEVVQEYTNTDCVHYTPVKATTDAAPCQLNFSSYCNTEPPNARSSGSCDSGSAPQWQSQRKHTSDELSVSRRSNCDIEEFYFDDVIHPELWKEKHMRLQSTLALETPKCLENCQYTDSPLLQQLEFEKTLELETPKYPASAVSFGRFKNSHTITRVTEDEAEVTENDQSINASNNSDVIDV